MSLNINMNAIPSLANVKDDNDPEFAVQEVSLSHVTLNVFCEAVVNIDPAVVLNTENLTSDEAHALVSSLKELHQACVQTNNFKPYLSAIFARAGYKLDV